MIIKNLIFILNNIIFLYLHQKIFNLKFSKFQFIITFILLNLISIFLEKPLIILFILLLLISTKLLKFNIYRLIFSSTIFLTLNLLTTFLSNILFIPNIFSTIFLIILTIFIIKKNIKIHLSTFPKPLTILNILINLILILQHCNLKNMTTIH